MRLTVRSKDLPFYLLLLLRVGSGVTANLAFLLLPFYALRSRSHAIESLLLSFIFTNLNPAIFPDATAASISRFAIISAAFVSVFLRGSEAGVTLRLNKFFFPVVIFSAFALLHSLLISVIPLISVLKVILWGVAFITLLQAWQYVTPEERKNVSDRIYYSLAVILAASILISPMAVAKLPMTTLVQGVLNHSQALGSVATFIAAWGLARILLRARPSGLDHAILAVSLMAIFYSGARTALISLLITCMLMAPLVAKRSENMSSRSLPGLRSNRFLMFLVIGLIVLLAKPNVIREVLFKAQFVDANQMINITDLYLQSRGELIMKMWANIANDPLFGIGFGIASVPGEMEITYAAGLPVGAVIEKGVTPIQVWEELGLIGLFIFFVMVFAFLRKVIETGPDRMAVLLSVLLINLGEASLLSAGGIGLIQLILIGWALTGEENSVKRLRYQTAFPAVGR